MFYRPAARLSRKRTARPFVHHSAHKKSFVPQGSRDGGFYLVVKIPFDDHQIGDPITDPAMIEKVLADHQKRFVVKIPDDAESWHWHPKIAAARAAKTPSTGA